MFINKRLKQYFSTFRLEYMFGALSVLCFMFIKSLELNVANQYTSLKSRFSDLEMKLNFEFYGLLFVFLAIVQAKRVSLLTL